MRRSSLPPALRAAMRAARSAAALPLNACAASAGTDADALIAALRSQPPRGRCPAGSSTAAALNQRSCPPPTRRAAADSADLDTATVCVLKAAGWAAFNTTTEQLSTSQRTKAALVAACPPAATRRLATDLAPSVRLSAAAHPNCPPAVLVAAAADNDNFVSDTALSNPNCPPVALCLTNPGSFRDAQHNAATHPNCPPAVLAGLCERSCTSRTEETLRQTAATNPAFPVSALEHLAASEAAADRAIAALHQRCPPQVLRQLMHDPFEMVRLHAHETASRRR